MDMELRMTEGNPMKRIMLFSIPILLGNLFQQFYNVMDSAIVGRFLGPQALASVGASSSVQFLVFGFATGICSGFAIPIAQQFGAEKEDEMRRYLHNGKYLAAWIAVVLAIITILACPLILQALQVSGEIYDRAYLYLVILFAGIPFTILYNYLSAILRAVGNSRTPFFFLVFSALLNIGLDVFCIVILRWDCAGAAIATVFSQAVSGTLCLILIRKKYDILRVREEEKIIGWSYMRSLINMGVPMGLQFSITAIGSMVMQAANNGLGTIYVSGFAAGAKLKQLMLSPMDAIGAGTATFLSQNYGADRVDRVRQGSRAGLILGIGYGILAGVLMVCFGRSASMLFVSADHAEVLDASALYLRHMGYFYPVLGILCVSRMSIQGLGYSSRAMYAGAIEMIARIVVALKFVPIYGFEAITWADQVAWMTAIAYLLPIWLGCLRTVEMNIANRKAGKLLGKENNA